jgi:hypothetical protein
MTRINLKIDPRLITKLPEMFGGNDQALRELLQNAYRAGARNVRAEWRPADKTLAIADDGAGEADPRNVFYPGRTGWNEKRVRNPAGLGLYALLTEETESIEFATQPASGNGWSARLTREDLEEKCVEVHEGRTLDPGTRVKITYRKNPWPDILEALERARGLYPFRLVLAVGGEEEEIPSRGESGDRDTIRAFQTQVGEVVLKKDCWHDETCESIWEYQIIQSKALKEAIDGVVRKHPERDVAEALFGSSTYGVRWLIDPDCNVRPRLPDRSDLIGGMTLDSAAYQIVHTVVEQVLGWADEWKGKWPDAMRIRKMDTRKLADGWVSGELVIRLMQRAGWQTVQWPDEAGIDIDCNSDGAISFWPDYKEVLVKNPIEVGSQALANAINRAGRAPADEKRHDRRSATGSGLPNWTG